MCVCVCSWPSLTGVAVVQPDAMSVILAVAFHGVVGEVALGHLEVWIYHDLETQSEEIVLQSHGGNSS